MAASGYMTEADTESIWSATLDTTRFGKINVRIGEVLNFYLTGDATTDITNTTVLPILEQLSEEALFELIKVAKITKVNLPMEWISANVVYITTRILSKNRMILERVMDKLETHHHIRYSNKLTLPSHSD